eukprot:gene6687-8273_t
MTMNDISEYRPLINDDIIIEEGYESQIYDLLGADQPGENANFKVYKSRFWVLGIFTLLSLNQCNFWITFGTVAPLAASYYNTSIANINWLSSLGPLVFIPFSMVFSWSLTRYGIRKNVILASACVAIGGAIRSIGNDKTFYLILIGQTFNAVAGPCVMVVPTKLSATWFAPSERTSSTAVGTLANFSGSAIGFILAIPIQSGQQLRYLLYAEAAFAGLLFICICIYFPEVPPSPPSATSFVSGIKSNHKKLSDSSVVYKEQRSLVESWKELIVNFGAFMTDPSSAILTLACGFTSGIYAGWSAIFVEIVKPLYTPQQSDWLGFYGIIAGLVGGIVLGIVHDRFHRFSFLVKGYLPNWYWLCQIINVSGGFLINSYYPIIYEAAVEVSYPIPESVSTAIISILINIITFVAIMIGSIIPPDYLNWMLATSAGISLILMFFIEENYKRSKNDNIAGFQAVIPND